MTDQTKTDLRYDVLRAPFHPVIAVDGKRYEIRSVLGDGDPFDEAHAEVVASGLSCGEAIAERARLSTEYAALGAALRAFERGEIHNYWVVPCSPS